MKQRIIHIPRIIIGIMLFFIGINSNATKLTISVEGPGILEYYVSAEETIIAKDTTFVIDINPEEEYLEGWTISYDKWIEYEIKSDGINYLCGQLAERVDDLVLVTKDVWYDCSISIVFKPMDLSDYVPITSSLYTNEFLSYKGTLLVDGIPTNHFEEVRDSYYKNSLSEKYVKKGTSLKISGGPCYYNNCYYDTAYELNVNGFVYDDSRCFIKEVQTAINCELQFKDNNYYYPGQLYSDGGGLTRLYTNEGEVSDYPGYGLFDYSNISGRDYIEAIPNEGKKIIQMSYNDENLLRSVLLNNESYVSGESLRIDWDWGSYVIKYGPISTPFVMAEDKEIYYGDEVGDLTWHTVEGAFTGEPTLSTTGTKESRTGTYPIRIERGTINKECSLFDGTLTIKKAPLVCKPHLTITQGEKLPWRDYDVVGWWDNEYDDCLGCGSERVLDIPIIYDGFKNGDDEEILFEKPTATIGISSTMVPGEYEITLSGGYSHEYEFIFEKGTLTILPSPDVINFADPKIRELCLKQWDTNKNGMLSYDEAAAVKTIGTIFKGNSDITTFDELKYFTGLTSLSDGSFLNCSSLESISIPSSVKTIGQNALSGCDAMSQINVEEDNEWFKSIDGVLFTKDESTLVQYPAARGTEYTVPDGTETIGRDAFYRSKLTSVKLPSART